MLPPMPDVKLPEDVGKRIANLLRGQRLDVVTFQDVRNRLAHELGVSSGSLDCHRRTLKDLVRAEVGRLQISKAGHADTMTRKEYLANAKPIEVTIGDKKFNMDPRTFSTGSSGFYTNTKITVEVAGAKLAMSCAITCVANGSKNWKVEE